MYQYTKANTANAPPAYPIPDKERYMHIEPPTNVPHPIPKLKMLGKIDMDMEVAFCGE